SLRLTKGFSVAGQRIEAIAEAFNLTNHKNFDVQSVQGGEFLSGPTAANPAAAAVRNPRFGQFTATLPAREFQLGLRWLF
ncbi:MAG TPA: hypothetical protein VN605_03115, partial [Thermoanaerobaculia bacterium]|nr:hypothetical protein [Thermoanaerobaculia bacterium]